MPKCQFSEDQFEQNLLSELRDRYGVGIPHFKPSRVIEPDLGFDFAVATDFWRVTSPGVYVNDPRIAGLMPAHRRAFLSGTFATSFIQCKRSDYLTQGRAPHAQHFQHWGEPIYRFGIDGPQNVRLSAVEQALQANAIVRYAAPCFWQLRVSDTLC